MRLNQCVGGTAEQAIQGLTKSLCMNMAILDLYNTLLNTSASSLGVTDSTANGKYPTIHKSFQTTAPNDSIPDGCFEIRFDLMEYIPWNNPDNIVSVEVKSLARIVKDYILTVLFLVGVPANLINMAVFYKQNLRDRVNLCLFALSLADAVHLTQAMIYNGEQLYLQHSKIGPFMAFLTNHNMVGLFGFQWVSQILSAIIACERCFCVFNPLKVQALLRTRTMAVIIILVNIVVVGLFFVVAVKHRVGCAYDPHSHAIFRMAIEGEFFQTHKEFITYLDGFVYGVGIPGGVIIVVTITTILTIVKLRQIVTWRTETSSSLSAREVALTKMLIANSIFFIICVLPTAVLRIVFLIFPEMNHKGRNYNFHLTGIWIMKAVSFINATFNFFVYYSMGSRYRKTFWELFTKRRNVDSNKKVTTMEVKKSCLI